MVTHVRLCCMCKKYLTCDCSLWIRDVIPAKLSQSIKRLKFFWPCHSFRTQLVIFAGHDYGAHFYLFPVIWTVLLAVRLFFRSLALIFFCEPLHLRRLNSINNLRMSLMNWHSTLTITKPLWFFSMNFLKSSGYAQGSLFYAFLLKVPLECYEEYIKTIAIHNVPLGALGLG